MPSFCPLYEYGLINGMYYYYGRRCSDCMYIGASDTVPHRLGGDCDCVTQAAACVDPIAVGFETVGPDTGGPGLGYLHGGAALRGFAGPRAGDPGTGRDDTGRFFLSDLHTTIAADREAWFVQGGRRFVVRLFELRLNFPGDGGKPAPPLRIGQELDPHGDHADAAGARYDGPGAGGAHRIRLADGTLYHVLMFQQVP